MPTVMDDAHARYADEFDQPYHRPGPIKGPPRPFRLPFSNTTLAIIGGVLLAALLVMLRGLPQPLAPLAVAETPTAETAPHPSIQPTPASEPGTIAAWWSPGGAAVKGGLLAESVSGPIARCPTFPDLVQVAIGGQAGPWVEAVAAGVSEEVMRVLPNAGGPCNPPTPTARPYIAQAQRPAPTPVVWATDTVEAVPVGGGARPTGEPPPPAATNCPIVLTPQGCRGPMVEVQP